MLSTLSRPTTTSDSPACRCTVCSSVQAQNVHSRGSWVEKAFAASSQTHKYFSPSYSYSSRTGSGKASPMSPPRPSDSQMVPPDASEINSAGSKKGPWSQEEDRQLLDAYDRFKNVKGGPVWKSIERAVPTRDAKQCRERYTQNLDPRLDHGPFTKEEERGIVELIRIHGNSWAKISKLLQHRRSDNAIKNWYSSYSKKRKRDEDDSAAVERAQGNPLSPSSEHPSKRWRHAASPSLQRPARRWSMQSHSLHRRSTSQQDLPAGAASSSPVDTNFQSLASVVSPRYGPNNSLPPLPMLQGQSTHYNTRSWDRQRQPYHTASPFAQIAMPTPSSTPSLPPPHPTTPSIQPPTASSAYALPPPPLSYSFFESTRAANPPRPVSTSNLPPLPTNLIATAAPFPATASSLARLDLPPLPPLQTRQSHYSPRSGERTPQRSESPHTPAAAPSPSYSPSATRERMSMPSLLNMERQQQQQQQQGSAGRKRRRDELAYEDMM